MSWKDAMYDAVAEYLRDEFRLDVVKVTDMRQETRNDGYCETCWYEYIVVAIDYVKSTTLTGTYEWHGNMGELVRAIT
jgi:hypothetical protein